MKFFDGHLRGIARVTLAVFIATTLYVPAIQASMLSTATLISHAQADQERAHIVQMMARQDVRQQFLSMGVDPSKVDARVAALSDSEVHQLATSMDSRHAGGDGLIGALVFVFLVLLITDLLGLTDIFPFVNHNRH